jgi:MFS family permease
MSSQFQLMNEQRFRPFFYTQFLGAFNDNVFKTTLVTLVAFHAASLTTIDGGVMATLLPGLFMLPYFLFSATAGQLADKYERSRIIRLVKLFEIGIMTFASLGFFLHNIWLLAAALFMMGIHSTVFGPVKFAYLPQHLNQQELMGGNGMVEMGSFVAILLGQILGAWLAMQTHHEVLSSVAVMGIAALGYFTSRGIPHSPAPAHALKINWNPITETFNNLKFSWGHQELWLAIIAISWFWFFGASLVTQFPNLAKQVLHGDESVFILLLAMFSIGVGIGSLLCEKLSKGSSGLGLVVFGSIGLTLFGADMYWSATAIHASITDAVVYNFASFVTERLSHSRLLIDVALLGLFGGFYIVPLYTLIQTRCEKSHQSRVIAGNNILNALFMVVSSGLSVLFLGNGYSIPQLFLAIALLNILIVIYLCFRQPEYIKSFLVWIKVAK